MAGQKKLMLLGGLRYLLPVIKKAHELGIYVITCDYIPDNIAHKYSDEYHNISIIDKEKVLELAQKLQIDGIMSFAVDPGVVTAAYVAEKMGLPFAGSYDAARILQNKDLFRRFLTENNFNVPVSGGYYILEEAKKDLERFTFPVIVKPVDSAGSKGVTKVDHPEQLEKAFQLAKEKSISKRVIIEEFIEQDRFSSDSDCFSIEGKLVFASFSDQMFEPSATNPYTPAAYVWPNSMTKEEVKELKDEIQRLFNLLHLDSSVYNIETRISKQGIPYIMEVSPRGGGNRISDILSKATNADLIEAAVKIAVGEKYVFPEEIIYDGVWAELILYSDTEGLFETIEIDKKVLPYTKEIDLWVKKGNHVHPFSGANETIGTVVFRFDDRKQLDEIWKDIRSHIRLRIKVD